MLQRAANNAYSWWWASHIRTKQSKWLEQNLQDVEEKVNSMLKIIEQEGDSFAKRAEMYYKKRPELINFVEETYRAYRALTERYDHLSKDLQSANRTLATVLPEQVQLSLESDDDESVSGTTAPSPVSEKSFRSAPAISRSIPKAPKLPKTGPQSMLVSKREKLRRNVNAVVISSISGMAKDEALKEIDMLQKEILSLQTEKEFVKSSYECGLARFWEIENKISEFQIKVCSLQDEFGIGTVIEDHEARSLMAGTALKSCAEALVKLQEEQERSMEEVKAEYERIKDAHERLEALKELRRQNLKPEQSDEELRPKCFNDVVGAIEMEEGLNPETLKQKIREQLKLDSHSALTEPELAEKVDDLVERIVSLETALCCQNALVKRLRQETDNLLAHIRSLEEDKDSLVEGSEMIKRIKELEEELSRVNGLNQEVMDQKNSLNTEIAEASCNVDHLKEKLPDVKPAEEGEYTCLFNEAKAEHEEIGPEKEKENDHDVRDSDLLSEQHKHEEEEKSDFSHTGDSVLDADLPDLRIEENGLNWRQLYLNNIEERERILVEEYTVILRDYKNMKMKLNESEKKNRDNIFELASLVRELRNTIAAKDEEIHHLRKLLAVLRSTSDGNGNASLEEIGATKQEQSGSPWASDVDPDRKPLFHHLYSRSLISEDTSLRAEDEIRMKRDVFGEQHGVARVEGRFRAQLNDLLEANLDFWLRFSTSFHQIQKFQTSIKDLQGELSKLMGAKKQQEGADKTQLKSDARPLYKHMREIQTELTLWLEHSSVFQEELRSRFSSLDCIQEEITQAGKDEASELNDFQAAKFQGEVLNMKQENSKVAEELLAGIHRVKMLKVEIEKALTKLDKEFALSESKSRQGSSKSVISKPRIPLHSFLFGIKLKKQKQKPSLFACVHPVLHKQNSTLTDLPE